MKKNIVAESRFTEPRYRAKVLVVVAHDAVAAFNSRRRRFSLDKETDFRALAVSNGGERFGMFFHLKELSHNSIAHELDHIKKYMFSWISSRPSEEDCAYLAGYLAEQVYKIFKKHDLEIK